MLGAKLRVRVCESRTSAYEAPAARGIHRTERERFETRVLDRRHRLGLRPELREERSREGRERRGARAHLEKITTTDGHRTVSIEEGW
jgi:hypothetical protein